MAPKLKFLLPDITTAHQVAGSLLLADIDNKNITVIAKPGTDLGQLQAATAIESADMIDNGRWVLVGAAVGLSSGMYLHYFQPWISSFMSMHWVALVIITTVIGALMPLAATAIFGVNLFDAGLKKYKKQIDDGAILILVTAPIQRANKIRSIVHRSHLKF